MSTDIEHKFELAVQLGNLTIAHELAKEAGSVQKWRQLSELATGKGDLKLTEECLREAQDFGGLLLLATATGLFPLCFLSYFDFAARVHARKMYLYLGDAGMVSKLAETAKTNGKNNIAFVCYMLLGELEKCLNLLIETDRIPEAAFFAR